MTATTFLALGTNLGNREENLENARSRISQIIGKIVAQSSIIETEPEGFDGNLFLNQVIKVETIFKPETLLAKTQQVEIELGRKEKTIQEGEQTRYSNRIIDVDILLYGKISIATEKLTIPHPRMFEREFVMKPLKEILLLTQPN